MLCERVGRFTYVGVQLRVAMSGLLERLCYQMHGSARVEAKGATLYRLSKAGSTLLVSAAQCIGKSEVKVRWCLWRAIALT